MGFILLGVVPAAAQTNASPADFLERTYELSEWIAANSDLGPLPDDPPTYRHLSKAELLDLVAAGKSYGRVWVTGPIRRRLCLALR
jgi:hypothetical protein